MTTPDDSGVPDDFRPTNLEMLGETGCPGCDALIAKTKDLAERILSLHETGSDADDLARWLLEEAKDEKTG